MKKAIYISVAIAVLFTAGIFIYFRYWGTDDIPTNTNATTNTQVNTTTSPENVNTSANIAEDPEVHNASISSLFTKTPVIIYTEDIGVDNSGGGGRMWPIKRIWAKTGDAEPVELATIGKVYEFPHYFFLSPNKEFLYISLESKVQRLNFQTGELVDIYTATKSINSMVFSSDGTKAILWDQKYADPDKDYIVQELNLNTLQTTQRASGSAESAFFVTAWRTDDTLVMSQPHGEFSTLWNFNLNTPQLTEVGDRITHGGASRHGTYVIDPKDYISNPCNDFWGSEWSTYELRNPVSGEVLMEIGDNERGVDIIAFTEDETGILYSSYTPWQSRDKCDSAVERQYFMFRTDDRRVSLLKNYPAGLDGFDIDKVGATIQRSGTHPDTTYSIVLNDQTLVSSMNELTIEEQFFVDK